MQRNYNKYQYETSPRKFEPEYVPKKNPYKKQKSTVKKQTNSKKQNEKKLKLKRRRIIRDVIIVFAILFAITYRNAKIDEKFEEVEDSKEQLATLDKKNTQLKIDIENSMNLSNLETEAKERLGMQKLNTKQTSYITLDRMDYIEAASEEVVIEEKKDNIIDKIMKMFK